MFLDDEISTTGIMSRFYIGNAWSNSLERTNVTFATIDSTGSFGGQQADVRARWANPNHFHFDADGMMTSYRYSEFQCPQMDIDSGNCWHAWMIGQEHGKIGSSLSSPLLMLTTSKIPDDNANITVSLDLTGNFKESLNCQGDCGLTAVQEPRYLKTYALRKCTGYKIAPTAAAAYQPQDCNSWETVDGSSFEEINHSHLVQQDITRSERRATGTITRSDGYTTTDNKWVMLVGIFEVQTTTWIQPAKKHDAFNAFIMTGQGAFTLLASNLVLFVIVRILTRQNIDVVGMVSSKASFPSFWRVNSFVV
jgi:hypothetical protein